MANSTIDISGSLGWLQGYDPTAYTALQTSIHNTDDRLDYLLNDLVLAVNHWKANPNKWTDNLKSFLVNIFQGIVIGVNIPKCTDLFDGNRFFPYIKANTSGFPAIEQNLSNDPLAPNIVITNPDLVQWAVTLRTTDGSSESTDLDNLGESIHTASSNFVYNSLFRPSQIQSVVGNARIIIYSEKEYYRLFQYINPNLPTPDLIIV